MITLVSEAAMATPAQITVASTTNYRNKYFISLPAPFRKSDPTLIGADATSPVPNEIPAANAVLSVSYSKKCASAIGP